MKFPLFIISLLVLCQFRLTAQCDSISFDCFNFDLSVDLAVDTAGQLSLCEGEPITFINQTTDNLNAIDSFVWIFNYLGAEHVGQECIITEGTDPVTHVYNFEDSLICTSPNQDFVLLSVGLSAIDTAGCFSLVQSNEIIINILPRALFTVNTSICTEQPPNINNVSCPNTANMNYLWESQPDGQTSTDFNPDFEYDSPGTYTISLTATSENCDFEDTYTQVLNVLEPPQPSFSIGNASTDSLCAELDTLILIDQSLYTDTSHWFIAPQGNVTYVNDEQGGDTVLVMFENPGNYNLTLITDNEGCSRDTTFSISVSEVALLNVNNLPDCIDTNVIDLTAYSNFNGVPDSYTITVTYLEDGSTQQFFDEIPTNLMLSGFGAYEIEIISVSECGEVRREGLLGYFPNITLNEVAPVCANQDTIINLNHLISPSNYNICVEWSGSSLLNDSLFNPINVGEGLYNLTLRDCEGICIEETVTIEVIGTALDLEPLNVCVSSSAINLDEILEGQWSGIPVQNDSLFPLISGVGNFDVYYVSNDTAICQLRDTMQIIVHDSLIIDYEVNTPNCIDSIFVFQNQSSGPVIQWDFTDGFTSTDENPTHQFISGGVYEVELIIGDVNACVDSVIIPVLVETQPEADFVVLVDSANCDSVDLVFNALSTDTFNSYQWFVNNDTLFGASVNYTAEVYDTISQIGITLLVQNSCGMDVSNQVVNIPAGFFADLIFDSEDVKCSGDTVDFILVANQVDSFIVDYGNGVIAINEVLDIPFTNNSDSILDYQVVIYGYSEECGWDTGGVIVPIQKDVPFASALYSDNEVCISEAITSYDNSEYQYETVIFFGDGNTALFMNDSLQYQYNNAGTYLPFVVAYGCGEDTNYLDPITVAPLPEFEIETTPQQPCLGDEIIMINNGNTISPIWMLDGDTLATFVDTLIFTPSSPGTYQIVLSATSLSNSFCSTTDTVEVTVSDELNVEIDVFPLTGCAPLNVTLEASSSDPSTVYNTNFGNQQVSQNNQASTIYNNGGDYQIHLTAINDDGCTLDTLMDVNVLDEYLLEAYGDSIVLIGEPVELDFEINQLYETFIWSTEDSILGENTVRPLIQYPTEDTWYHIAVDGIDSTCFAKDSLFVKVECDELFLPNAFSPNNDGINDTYSTFKVFSNYQENTSLSCVNFIDISIFDRWGELIFFSDEIGVSWDGTYKNKSLNAGIYTAIVNYSINNEIKSVKKEIHLIK